LATFSNRHFNGIEIGWKRSKSKRQDALPDPPRAILAMLGEKDNQKPSEAEQMFVKPTGDLSENGGKW